MTEKQTPQEQLAAEYDIGDTHFDPAVDLEPEGPGKPVPVLDSQASALPPRAPDGTFVKKSPHSKLIMRTALQMGYTQDEIDETPAEDLRAVIAVAQKQRDISHVHANLDRKEAVEPAKPVVAEPDELELDPEYFETTIDPRMRKPLQALVKRVKALEQQNAALTQHVAAQSQRAVVETLDTEFAKYPEFFGEGKAEDMDKSSIEFKRRRRLVSTILDDKDEKTPTLLQVRRAIKDYHPHLVAQDGAPAPAPAKAKPAEPTERDVWYESGAARPTHRDAQELPKGEKRALLALSAKMRETPMGSINVNGYSGNEESGIPD